MKIMLVAGARPNFMKIASIVDAIHTYKLVGNCRISSFLVHTGQHYDERMSLAFFQDLGLPEPDVNLGVGSASHAQQTAELMSRFEPILLRERPDVVVVVGDVNSTMACSLVAAKVVYPLLGQNSFRSRPLIAHVEAGLRSFDRSMPEELNRILTDALSDFLFITEKSAQQNLLREGIAGEKIYFVGNTMVDTLLKHKKKAEESSILLRLGLGGNADTPSPEVCPYGVVTLHRPSNVDNPKTLQELLEALSSLAREIAIFFPVHPRTAARIREFGLDNYLISAEEEEKPSFPRIHCLEPLGYLDFLCLMSHARLVLTDSGGIQEETTVLGVPCVTLRQNTERPVTITDGTNILAAEDRGSIIHHAFNKLNEPVRSQKPPFWDGLAGTRIVQVLARHLSGLD